MTYTNNRENIESDRDRSVNDLQSRTRSHSLGNITNPSFQNEESTNEYAHNVGSHSAVRSSVSAVHSDDQDSNHLDSSELDAVGNASIASIAVNNATSIVSNILLNSEAATNLALETVDLGGNVMPPPSALKAAGVILPSANSNNGVNSPLPPSSPQETMNPVLIMRRRSSQISIKRTSQSRSPPPVVDPNLAASMSNGSAPLSNNELTNDDASHANNNSEYIDYANQPLAQAVMDAICLQQQQQHRLIRRSTSAATSYMASDEDNNDEDNDSEMHIVSRTSGNCRETVNIGNGVTDQESGYGASTFSMTSSGRSSVGNNVANKSHRNKHTAGHNRTVRIVDSRDSDYDLDDGVESNELEIENSSVSRNCNRIRQTTHSVDFRRNQLRHHRTKKPHSHSNDEEDRYSIEEVSVSAGPSNAKHVTLDVRFADENSNNLSTYQGHSAASDSVTDFNGNPPNIQSCLCYHSKRNSLNADYQYHSSTPQQSRHSSLTIHSSKDHNVHSSYSGSASRRHTTHPRAMYHVPHHIRNANQTGSLSSEEDAVIDQRVASSSNSAYTNNNNEPLYVINMSSPERTYLPKTIAKTTHRHSCDKYRQGTSTSSTPPNEKRRVNLLVEDVRFQVDVAMLQTHPDTMLGRMFNSSFDENRRGDEDINIGLNSGVSASLFRTILDYYRIGQMSCPPGVHVQELKEACDYFLIPFNHRTVKCGNIRAFLHELSNDGAFNLFERFLEAHILPKLVECARLGERECHLVILLDDEVIDWDEDYPPQMIENEMNSHLIYNTQMFRFLKYIENREMAKQVLQGRGMKKIRIGIEGYPTNKEKIKYRGRFRPEVIYNYAQRPFIRMSWEEEENKSRHVDFQCVKSKSVSDLTNLEHVVDLATAAVVNQVHLPTANGQSAGVTTQTDALTSEETTLTTTPNDVSSEPPAQPLSPVSALASPEIENNTSQNISDLVTNLPEEQQLASDNNETSASNLANPAAPETTSKKDN